MPHGAPMLSAPLRGIIPRGILDTARQSCYMLDMAETFIPLMSSTIRSSLWSLSGDCIKVFLTLALEAGPDGVVIASIDGIRRIVDLPIDSVKAHIVTLESPDEHSKDIARGGDGRRLERVSGGWRVVNMDWYRAEARRQAELFRKRKWWDEKGDAARRDARRTETETETEMDQEIPPKPPEGERAVVSPKPRSRKTKAALPLPADWAPTKSHVAYAKEHGLDLAAEVKAFRLWSDGQDRPSWNGTFATRLSNSVAFGRGPKATPGKVRERSAADVLKDFR